MTPYELMRLARDRNDSRMPETLANGFIVAYFFNEVLVGRWENGKAVFAKPCNWAHLMQMHIFNADEEFRALFSNDYASAGASKDDGWLTRYQHDDAVLPPHKDEKMIIIGNGPDKGATAKERETGFAVRGEAGRRITLPVEACAKRLWVRNYLRFDTIDDTSDALPLLEAMRISDYRFVGFADWTEETPTGGIES